MSYWLGTGRGKIIAPELCTHRHSEGHIHEVNCALKLLIQNVPSRALPTILKQWNYIIQHLLCWLLWTRSAGKELFQSNTLTPGFPAQQAAHNSIPWQKKQWVVNNSSRRKTPQEGQHMGTPHISDEQLLRFKFTQALKLGIHRTSPLWDAHWKGIPINCISKLPSLKHWQHLYFSSLTKLSKPL